MSSEGRCDPETGKCKATARGKSTLFDDTLPLSVYHEIGRGRGVPPLPDPHFAGPLGLRSRRSRLPACSNIISGWSWSAKATARGKSTLFDDTLPLSVYHEIGRGRGVPPLPDPHFAGPLGLRSRTPYPCSRKTVGLLTRSGKASFHSLMVLVAMNSPERVRLHAMQRAVPSRQVAVIASSSFWLR